MLRTIPLLLTLGACSASGPPLTFPQEQDAGSTLDLQPSRPSLDEPQDAGMEPQQDAAPSPVDINDTSVQLGPRTPPDPHYNLEGRWYVTLVPDPSQPTTCEDQVTSGVTEEQWSVVGDVYSGFEVDRGEQTDAIEVDLISRNTYRLVYTMADVPPTGWTVTVEQTSLSGKGWMWFSSLGCGHGVTVVGHAR